MMPAGVTLDDPHARLACGMEIGEAVRRTVQWWDREARHVNRNPEWNDPDLGMNNGILRGLKFEHLTTREAYCVIAAWIKKFEAGEFDRPLPKARIRPRWRA